MERTPEQIFAVLADSNEQIVNSCIQQLQVEMSTDRSIIEQFGTPGIDPSGWLDWQVDWQAQAAATVLDPTACHPWSSHLSQEGSADTQIPKTIRDQVKRLVSSCHTHSRRSRIGEVRIRRKHLHIR